MTTGAQPDWYLGFSEGLIRVMPGWEISAWGHTLIPGVLIPFSLFPLILLALGLYPFVEGGSPATSGSTTSSTGRATCPSARASEWPG